MTDEQFKRFEALLVHIADLLHDLVYIGEHEIYQHPDQKNGCKECVGNKPKEVPLTKEQRQALIDSPHKAPEESNKK